MIPVSVSVRVASRLRSAPDGPVPVVHRGRDAIYLDQDGWCVGVISTRATAVPCALRTGADRVPEAATAELRGGVLHLDDVPLVVGRLLDVQVPRVRATVATPASPPGDVAAMIGRGDGLTPYDDDVLCGWLAVHRAAGVTTDDVDAEVRRHLGRTTLLSATLLDCAMHGEVIPEFAVWLAAPRDPARTAALAAVGHTSGRGMLHGARVALDHLEGAAA